MLTLAAAAETHSNHPVAQAVVRVAREAKIAVPEAVDVHEEAGKGVTLSRQRLRGDDRTRNLAERGRGGLRRFPAWTRRRWKATACCTSPRISA